MLIVFLQLQVPLEGTGEEIQCSVKLTGPSVLQGVKQCIASDIVTLPVPSLLTALHSSGSNSVVVQPNTAETSIDRDSLMEDDPTNQT